MRYNYPLSQFVLGSMYVEGTGTARDFDKSLKWFTKALESGQHNISNYYIGMIYFYGGFGVDKDYKKALHWLLKASDVTIYSEENDIHNSVEAQYYIGNMYHLGYGTPIDYSLALKWYKKAAEYNHKEAICNIGNIYISEDGFQNQDLGCHFLKRSAELGEVKAMVLLGCFYHNISDWHDYKKAMYWFRKAVASGTWENPEEAGLLSVAQRFIGEMYRCGHGVSVDNDLASQWFKKSSGCDLSLQIEICLLLLEPDVGLDDKKMSVRWLTDLANQGHVESQLKLGDIHCNDSNTTFRDYKLAMHWFKKAVDNTNDAKAQFFIGLMYKSGLGVQRNGDVALSWIRKSADQGYSKAQNNLGLMYYKGEIVDQNYNEALMWFKKSAKNDGNGEALYNIGSMYYIGLGIVKNINLALSYFTESAEMGNRHAIKMLKKLKSDDNTSTSLFNDDIININSVMESLGSLEIDLHKNSSGSDNIRRKTKPKFFHVEDMSTVLLKSERIQFLGLRNIV